MKTLISFLFLFSLVANAQEDSLNCQFFDSPFKDFGSLEEISKGNKKAGKLYWLKYPERIDSLAKDSTRFERIDLTIYRQEQCGDTMSISASHKYDDGSLICDLQYLKDGYFEFEWKEEHNEYYVKNLTSSVAVYRHGHENLIVIYWCIIPKSLDMKEPFTKLLVIDLKNSPYNQE